MGRRKRNFGREQYRERGVSLREGECVCEREIGRQKGIYLRERE